MEQHQLDKLSMQGVSNSLRSNLTNANAEASNRKIVKKRKVKDELGSMVHLRGNFVVNVTMRLGTLVNQVGTFIFSFPISRFSLRGTLTPTRTG